VRPFANPAPARQVGAVWRKSSARGAAIAGICDIIVATIRAGEAAPARSS
jgi:hypothetical protein